MKIVGKLFGTVAIGLAGTILTGCGGDTADTATATYDITVERGPLLHAIVMDSAGARASEVGNGRYRFQNAPVYPVKAYNGFIDIDRDGTVSVGDVNNTLLLETREGTAATLVSSIALSDEIRAWLKENYGLTDETIDNATPSTDKTVAAISDELYAYCIENGIVDPATLTLAQMQQIQNRIQSRIESYTQTETPVSDLEEQLISDLNITTLTQTDVDNFRRFGGGSGIVDLALALPESNLTDAQKYTIAYMWNEEKMAKDLYLALDALYAQKTFSNIATKSETKHQEAVEALAQKYDLNISDTVDFNGSYSQEALASVAPGEFTMDEIKSLYDTLYAKGQSSLQDALETGCMVEVTDVDDLLADIETAQGADDLVLVYNFLLSGSYNHYWAFDRALKANGVADGCCSLGEEYCKSAEEYPASNNMGSGSTF